MDSQDTKEVTTQSVDYLALIFPKDFDGPRRKLCKLAQASLRFNSKILFALSPRPFNILFHLRQPCFLMLYDFNFTPSCSVFNYRRTSYLRQLRALDKGESRYRGTTVRAQLICTDKCFIKDVVKTITCNTCQEIYICVPVRAGNVLRL